MFEGDGLLKVGGKLLVVFFGKEKAAKKEWIGVRWFLCLGWFFSCSRQEHGGHAKLLRDMEMKDTMVP